MVKFRIVEEVGYVKSIEGTYATVVVHKKSSCEGCSLKICKPNQEDMEIQAFNGAHAQVGQKVKVVLKPYTFLRGSMVVYGIPALALVFGAVVGKELLSRLFAGSDPDLISAAAGFAAFLFSFLMIRLWSSKQDEKPGERPVISEIFDN